MNLLFALVPLLVLAACSRPASAPAAAPTPARTALSAEAFEDVTKQAGLDFYHFTGATGEFYLPEIMGSGVALFDYDSDGDLDVFLVQGDFIDVGKTRKDARYPLPNGWKPGSRLFRNETIPKGKLSFTDVTGESGISTPFDAMGAAVGDYDNNGTLDLLVTGLGRSLLFKNLGNGKFANVSRETGIADPDLSTSAAFVDYDRDGFLDLFVAHYVHGTTVERKKCRNPFAELDYCGPQAFPPAVARLYHNEKGQRFRDVTQASGIGAAAGPGLGVQIGDFNADGYPDIYVANDGAASYLWVNKKDGTFVESALEMGLAYSADGKAQAGMGIALGDIDNDGTEEVFKTNLIREGANVYKRNTAGFYTDIAANVRVAGATAGQTGFGVALADFDNDGWLDAFIANGAVIAMEQQHSQPYPYRQPNLLFRNAGGVMEQVPATSGPLSDPGVSRGVALGDLDNDGAIDIVITNNNGPARLFRNRLGGSGGAQNHWLRVRLQSHDAGTHGFQALVRLVTASGKALLRHIEPSGSYLSATDPSAHFGLGPDQGVRSLTVEWPNGKRSEHPVPAVDRELTIRQP